VTADQCCPERRVGALNDFCAVLDECVADEFLQHGGGSVVGCGSSEHGERGGAGSGESLEVGGGEGLGALFDWELGNRSEKLRWVERQLVGFHEKLPFVFEVVDDECRVDPGCAGDGSNGRPFEPHIAKFFPGGGENGVFRQVGVSWTATNGLGVHEASFTIVSSSVASTSFTSALIPALSSLSRIVSML